MLQGINQWPDILGTVLVGNYPQPQADDIYWWQLLLKYTGYLMGLWSSVVMIICFSETHRFSILKSILVNVVAFIILFLVLAAFFSMGYLHYS